MHNLVHQPENDIKLDNNQVIEWFDFNPESDKNVDITYLTTPLVKFFKTLETECLSECCGIDAFDFSEENIKQNLCKFDKDKLIQNLLTILNDLEFQDTISVSSTDLNQLFHKKTFADLVSYI